MPFTFTRDQRDELQALLAARNADDPTVRFDDIYKKILEFIESSNDADVKTIAVFLRGAVQVNGGFGSFSEMVRGYTQRQLELRGSAAISDANMTTIMQQASNAIARNITRDIIDSGALPTIQAIAVQDASGAVLRFFQPNLPADDTAASSIAAGWAGTPFFSHFGDWEMWRLLSRGEDAATPPENYTMNRLDDLRNVLFAFDSMAAGLHNQTFSAWVRSWWEDKRVNLDTFGDQAITFYDAATGALALQETTVARGYALAAGQVLSAFSGTVSPALSQLFAAMGRYGQNNVLDQIRGAYAGELRYGTTYETFLQSARDFFSGISATQLQSVSAESLAGFSVSQLIDKALSDDKYRNALRGLSAFVLDLPSYNDRAVDLYDIATGAGSITMRWIEARAKMLGLRMLMDHYNAPYDELWHPSATTFAPLLGDRVFSDLVSGLTLGIDGIDFGVVNPIRTVFGAATAETILGTAGRDEIFGDGGDDALWGGTDADYLEGDAGVDYLYGEGGDDELVGGSGDDYLTTGSGKDTLDGGAGFDTYAVSSDACSVVLRDADGNGTIKIERADHTMYTLGSSAIREVSGSPGHYEDADGNRYQFNGNDLSIALEDGRTIQIDNFQAMQGSRLGLNLQGPVAPVEPADAHVYNVGAPNQIVEYPAIVNGDSTAFDALVNSIGVYAGGWTGSPESGGYIISSNEWSSAGVRFHRRETEVINVSAALVNPDLNQVASARARGGMGDSYITGDNGVNIIRDDSEMHFDDAIHYGAWTGNSLDLGVHPVAPNLAIGIWGPNYNMADVMGNDVIHTGGGNDVIYTSGGDDSVFAGGGNDHLIDTHSGSEARFNESYTYNGVTAYGVSYLYDWDSTQWLHRAGHSSDDRMYGEDGDDYLYAHGGNQLLDGGTGNDQLVAGAGNDVLVGGEGNDMLAGDMHLLRSPFSTGNIYISDTEEYGSDVLDGGDGEDTLYGGGGNDTLMGGAGNDVLQGDFRGTGQVAADPESIGGDDTIFGGAGEDTIYGGAGDDYIDSGNDGDTVYAGRGNDIVIGGEGTDTLIGDDDGPQGNDEIRGGAAADVLRGMGGNDALYGDAGLDELYGGAGADSLYGGDDDDLLVGDDGNDYLSGGAGHDRLQGGGGRDVLEAQSGSDELSGGAGNDTFVLNVGAGLVRLDDTEGMNTLSFGAGIADTDIRVRMINGEVSIDYSQTDSAVMSTATFETLTGIQLGASQSPLSLDQLRSRFQPGILVDGAIQLLNGVNTSQIAVSSRNEDLVLGYSGEAIQWVNTSTLSARGVQYQLVPGTAYGLPVGSQALVLTNWFLATPGTYIDQLVDQNTVQDLGVLSQTISRRFVGTDTSNALQGTSGVDELFGRAGDDLIDGAGGDDFLSGDVGSDLLNGGAGDDAYGIDLGDGEDVITDESGTDFILFGEGIAVGDVSLQEVSGGLRVQIGAAASGDSVSIAGAAGARSIEYMQFADGTLWNAAAIESRFNHAPQSAQALEQQSASIGQMFTFAVPTAAFQDPDPADQLTLSAALSNGESLPSWLAFNSTTRTFSGTAPSSSLGEFDITVRATDSGGLSVTSAFTLLVVQGNTGTAAADTLYGTSDADHLDGLGGNDTLYGLDGNDVLDGGSGTDLLDGGLGVDVMRGGAGNDVYMVDDINDSVIEATEEGVDEVRSSISLTLAANVENIALTGAANVDAIGNELANTLLGNTGNNVLDGGLSNDTLRGGLGDDTYIVDSAADSVQESGNEGTDTVRASVTYSLGNNLENLALLGSADINGMGNALANLLAGNDGRNTLDGGAGADTLIGGLGEDTLRGGFGNNTYVFGIGDGQDVINSFNDPAATKENTLQLSQGVLSSDIRWSRDEYYDVQLSIAGTADSVRIKDYHSSPHNPVQQLRFSDGTTLQVAYQMASGETSLVMGDVMAIGAHGNESNNIIIGTSLSNLIDGMQGVDTLIGGAGDDVYVVDTARSNYFWDGSPELWSFLDTVTEQSEEGYDTIIANDVYSATLAGNVEKLVVFGQLSFTASFNVTQDVRRTFTGNALNNVINARFATGGSLGVGYTGSNGYDLGETVLNGGAGADLMIGPSTTTRFVVDDANDVVVSNSSITRIDSFINYTLAPTFRDLTLVGSAAITGTGNALNNVLDGAKNVASNVLIGGAGNDTYIVGAGDVVQELSNEGIDTVRSSATYTLGENFENLTLMGTVPVNGYGNALDNIIIGTSNAVESYATNYLVGGAGNDQLLGGSGNDTYADFGTTSGVDVVTDTAGSSDRIQFSANEDIDVTQLQFSRSGNDLFIRIDAEDSILVKSWYTSPSNVIERLTVHQDGLWFQYTNVQMQGRADGVNTAPVANTLGFYEFAEQGALEIQLDANAFLDIESQLSLTYSVAMSDGNVLPDWLTFDAATRTFSGSAPSGGMGTYTISVTAVDAGGLSASTTFDLNIVKGPLMGTEGDDALTGDSSDDMIDGLSGNDMLYGLAGFDALYGGAGNDQLYGGADDDYLDDWEGGNDLMDGGAGADSMYGGVGNDIYIVDHQDDYLEEYQDEGVDEVRSSITYTLDANVENLTLTGSVLTGTGNALDNVLIGNGSNNTLIGNAGNDTLNGGSGSDTMRGGVGNDTYVVAQSGDVVTENAGEGTDTVQSSITYTLTANLENLTLTGSTVINGTGNTVDNVLTGNSVSNTLSGNAGNDTLNGGAGNDTLAGGAGNDTYQFGTAFGQDLVVETASDAQIDTDVVVLGAGILPASVVLSRVGDDLVLTLSTASDKLTLQNFFAATYPNANIDSVRFADGTIWDVATLRSMAGSLTGTAGNDTLNGTASDDLMSGLGGNDTLNGNAGNDTLDGGTGGDSLNGGLGNDTFVVDNATDVVTEAAGQGTDRVDSSVTWTLGANIENLTLTGTANVNGVGNTLANVIHGNGGSNTLDGGAGADSLLGGAGNDIYVVDNVGDVITESPSAGTDLVQSSVTYTLSANVENLTLTTTAAINATGNTLANVLTGNTGNNVLDGGAGSDTMVGGAGNDTYVVESTGDAVTEAASAGTDVVQASINYTLGTNVENLTLTGTAALTGTGNTLANTLTGNSGDNVLDGAAGADTMIGGAGNDTYVVDATGDVVTEAASQGTDLVRSSITHTLGANVENLTLTGTGVINGTGNTLNNVLTGNSVNNTLSGGAGNDTIDGAAGTDTMTGGAGNDIYYVDVAADVTTENANEGIDLVNSAATRTLAANIELLFLTGTSAINGTGNTLANLLRGNTMNNTLVGGGGTDILEGGAGNDTLSNTTGNTLLNGGAGTDTLTGGSNNDLLIGGLGNDALTTGTGADIIAFNKGDGQDTVAISTTKDNTLSIGGGARYADLLFTKNGNDLVLKVGATDQVTLTGYYANTANRSVNRLQIVIEGTADYVPGSSDVTKKNKIETFNFDGLVSAFDAARTANPSLTSWALSGSLAAQFLSGSDTAALGGDLAYRYARLGSLSDISFSPAISLLSNASFGTAAQTLQPLTGLQDSTPRLN